MDFNQSAFLGVAANPLVAQNCAYTRYETRVNEPEYSALALSGWSQGQNLPDQDHPAQLPAGSIAVKAAWRLLTAADTPAVRARYYVVENANVVDVAKTLAARRVVCSKSDVALVGLHIVIRTSHRPQGLWATFERVDNVPPAGAGEPDARDAGAPYSYFNTCWWPSNGRATPIQSTYITTASFFQKRARKTSSTRRSRRTSRIHRRAACPAIRVSTRAGATSSAYSAVFAESVIAAAHCAGRTSFASRMTFPVRSEP